MNTCIFYFLLLTKFSFSLGTIKRRSIEAGTQIHECTVPGTFALTFDDGPFQYTQQLLSILRRLNVTATFFAVGELVDNESYGSILKDVLKDGHQIASHSYTHPHMNELDDTAIENEILNSKKTIERMIEKPVNYFRCPYGECEEKVLSVLRDNDIKVINWNIDSLDWTGRSPQEIIDFYEVEMKSADPTKDSFISLQHDIQPNSIAVASRLIKMIRDKGFYLTTIAECMGEKY